MAQRDKDWDPHLRYARGIVLANPSTWAMNNNLENKNKNWLVRISIFTPLILISLPYFLTYFSFKESDILRFSWVLRMRNTHFVTFYYSMYPILFNYLRVLSIKQISFNVLSGIKFFIFFQFYPIRYKFSSFN